MRNYYKRVTENGQEGKERQSQIYIPSCNITMIQMFPQ